MKIVKNLYEWKIIRNSISYPEEGLTHQLWETNDDRFGFYLYHIGEWGQLRFYFRLQILKDKFNPKLIFESKDKIFDYSIDENKFTKWDLTDKDFLAIWQIMNGGYSGRIIFIDLLRLMFITISEYYNEIEVIGENLILKKTGYFSSDERNSTNELTIKLNEANWKQLKNI